MSKKVVTFLVVLFATTAVLVVLIKQAQKPASTVQTQKEAPAPAATGEGPAEETITGEPADENSDEEVSGEEPAAANGEEAEAVPAPDADATGTNENGEDAAEEETPAEEESAPDESGDEEAAAETKAAPAVTDSGGSLLSPSASLYVDMDNALAERTMGDPDAPVTVIEYASMTCPHCARFSNQILPTVKAQLIDTGKLRLVYRDYPLDTHALKASMMARCTDRSKYFNLIEVIFKNQERWVKSSDPLTNLKQLGALAGMEGAYIDSCLANKQLEQHILAGMQDAQRKYKINATPTFIFNSGAETLSGDQDPEDFAKIVDKLIKKGK